MLSLFEILLIAFAMSADAFFMALGVAGKRRFRRQTFRLAFHFGLFQGLMPLLGWFAGVSVQRFVQSFSAWLACGILVLIGAHMVWEAFHNRGEEETAPAVDRSRGWSLVSLSVATSIDAFAVGVALGVERIPILLPCVVIALVTGINTFVAVKLARRVKSRFGLAAEATGGLLLILVGFRMLDIAPDGAEHDKGGEVRTTEERPALDSPQDVR